jgi:hypothetical protein
MIFLSDVVQSEKHLTEPDKNPRTLPGALLSVLDD